MTQFTISDPRQLSPRERDVNYTSAPSLSLKLYRWCLPSFRYCCNIPKHVKYQLLYSWLVLIILQNADVTHATVSGANQRPSVDTISTNLRKFNWVQVTLEGRTKMRPLHLLRKLWDQTHRNQSLEQTMKDSKAEGSNVILACKKRGRKKMCRC